MAMPDRDGVAVLQPFLGVSSLDFGLSFGAAFFSFLATVGFVCGMIRDCGSPLVQASRTAPGALTEAPP
ncbi:hypothetical protein [Methylorubrum extorquens]